MEGGQYLQRADLASLKRVFNKYSSLSKDGVNYLSYEDLIVRWDSLGAPQSSCSSYLVKTGLFLALQLSFDGSIYTMIFI